MSMACLADVFCEQDRTNWLKAWLALNIAKSALGGFVDEELKDIQTRIFKTVRSRLNLPQSAICTSCYTANLLKCPTQNVCKKKGKNTCKSMHNDPTKQHRPCSMKLCDEVRDEIIKEHRYGEPSWKNTLAEQWSSNHWQIAKCFLPPDGYITVNSVGDTDFNGVVSVMLNCKHFDSKVSFSISPKQANSPCLLTKAREIGKAVRHTSDCTVADTDLQDYFRTLNTLLRDSTCLALYSPAQDALQKLSQLQNDRLKVTQAELSHLLKDVNDTLKKAAQDAEEIIDKIERHRQELNEHLQASLEKCQQKLDERMNQIMKDGKDDIKDHIQESLAGGKKKLEQTAQECINSIHKANDKNQDSIYAEGLEELLRRLRKHYNHTLSTVSAIVLIPRRDIKLQDLYVIPNIQQTVPETGKGSRKKPIRKYKDVFYNGDRNNRHIFLQGVPGVGKSTFAAKLVLDWCNSWSSSINPTDQQTAFSDVETLTCFKIVFFIRLRDSSHECKVAKMIKEQIIDMIYQDEDCENANKLLQRILEKENYVVVEDGLDEWADSHKKLVLPLIIPSTDMSTVLYTTRPWKMVDERIKNSKIDCLLELEGIDDPNAYSKTVLGCFIAEDLEVKHEEFKTYIATRELDEQLAWPMLHTLIIYSWVEGMHLKGSLCEMYSILMESLLQKANKSTGYFHQPPFQCFANTKYIQPNMELINGLSKAAFCLLFSFQKQNSVVFSEKELSKYISEEQKSFALKAGIISERKSSSLANRFSTCSFIHKSVQEFLAAYHIACNTYVIDDVVSNYLAQFTNSWLEMSSVFIYLCGLNIVAANELSSLADHCILTLSDFHKCALLQNIAISGYKEAKDNKYDDKYINLKLDKFCEYVPLKDFDVLKFLIKSNMTNISCLFMGYELNGPKSFYDCLLPCELQEILTLNAHCLKHLHISVYDCFGMLDLACCQNLETLHLSQPITLLPITLSVTSNLKHLTLKCSYDGLDLSMCHQLEKIELGEQVKLIPNTLNNLQNLKHLTLDCKYDRLDLSTCESLEVVILNSEVTLPTDRQFQLKTLKYLMFKGNCLEVDLSTCRVVKTYASEKVEMLMNTIPDLKRLRNVTIAFTIENCGLCYFSTISVMCIGKETVQLLVDRALQGLKDTVTDKRCTHTLVKVEVQFA